MIYILNEQIMNGTVTMKILTKGIKANTFDEAIERLKQFPNFSFARNIEQDKDSFSYCIPPKDNEVLFVIGLMKSEPLEIM